MSITSKLINSDTTERLSNVQLQVSRTILLVTVALYLIRNFQDLELALGGSEVLPPEYVYLRFALSGVVIVFILASLVLPNTRRAFKGFSTWLYLAFFYTVALGLRIEGEAWQGHYLLLVIAALAYTSYMGTYSTIIFTVLANLVVAAVSFESIVSGQGLDFFIVFLVGSIGLAAVKLVQGKGEHSLIELDQFFERVLNSLRDAVYLVDPANNTVIFANHGAIKTFGAAFGDIRNLVSPESRETFATALKMIYTYKGNWEGEIQFNGLREQNFFAMCSISYLKINEDEFMFIKLSNISKLKAAEKQLKDVLAEVKDSNAQLENSKRAIMNILEDVVTERADAMAKQQKLNAVMQSIVEGVMVVDLNRRIYLYNDAALKMLGISAKEMETSVYSDILKLQDELTGKPIDNFVEDVFSGQPKTSNTHSVILRNDGTTLPVSETTAPIYNEKQEVLRVVVVLRDATEQRKIDKMRSEFVSVASHQLRTPLTSINWYVEFLSDPAMNSNLTEQQKDSVNRIADGNRRMLNLVNELLNVSRIETGKKLKLEVKEDDLISLTREVVDEQEVTARMRNISINFNYNRIEKQVLNMDRGKIREVIMNLVSNAVKYSHENSTVDIRFGKDDKYIYLDVADHGIGIPKDQQERVFEKFFRAENAVTQQTEGTGLGMYIARSIARAHQGELSFYSIVNEGSTFTLKLPLVWQPGSEEELTAF